MAKKKDTEAAPPAPAQTEAQFLATPANKLKALLRASKKTKEQTQALAG
jgi:hypothetical protein